MIDPDAKCVVNGPKVNETIRGLNPLLNMEIVRVAAAQGAKVVYGAGGVQLLIPLANSVEGFEQEEIDIVDSANAPSTRFFMTSETLVSNYGTITASNTVSASPTGSSTSTSTTTSGNKNRSQLSRPGPSQNNRNSLNIAGNGGLQVSASSPALTRAPTAPPAPPAPVSQRSGSGGGGGRVVNPDTGGGGSADTGGGGSADSGFSGADTVANVNLDSGASRSGGKPKASKAPRISGPAAPPGTGGIPLTASGYIDLSKMTPQQKAKYGFMTPQQEAEAGFGDNIPLTASGYIDLRLMTRAQREKYGFTVDI